MPNPIFDLMLDLETLDNKPSSVILSIGAVAFDPETDAVNTDLTFHKFLRLDEQLARGRTVSESTVLWWLDQDDTARVRQIGAKREQVVHVLQAFTLWLEEISDVQPQKVRVWGNGAAFDNAALASLYTAYGMEPPWKFWNDRCYRTVKALAGTKPADYGVAHDAVDDAIKQSKHLQQIMAHNPWKHRSA